MPVLGFAEDTNYNYLSEWYFSYMLYPSFSLYKKCSDVKNDKDSEVTLEFSWDTVKRKLTDSITAIENGTKLENEITESGQTANQTSSLSAIAEGPRFRLMWSSFQWLKNEVGALSKYCFGLLMSLSLSLPPSLSHYVPILSSSHYIFSSFLLLT